jgi:hypothetical protein
MGESSAAGTRRLGCGYSIRGFVFILHCPAVGRKCIGSCDLFTQGGNLLIELFKLCQGERYGAAGCSKGRSGGEGYGGARVQSKSFQYSSADPFFRRLPTRGPHGLLVLGNEVALKETSSNSFQSPWFFAIAVLSRSGNTFERPAPTFGNKYNRICQMLIIS